MGTRNHPALPNYAYFVTTTVDRRRPIFASVPAARLFLRVLADVRRQEGCLLLAYVVMPDHVHLALVPGRFGLGYFMKLVKGRFARLWNLEHGLSGSIWQERYYEAVIRSEEQLRAYIEYVHNNPVKGGLVEHPPVYPWSSACRDGGPDLARYLTGKEPD